MYAGAWNVSRLVTDPIPKTGVDGKPCGRICCLKGRAASENWSYPLVTYERGIAGRMNSGVTNCGIVAAFSCEALAPLAASMCGTPIAAPAPATMPARNTCLRVSFTRSSSSSVDGPAFTFSCPFSRAA